MRPTYECPENIRESLTVPTATFHEIFHWDFLPIDNLDIRAKFEVRSFNRS